MTPKFNRLSIFVPALLALTAPATHVFAQTTTTKSVTPPPAGPVVNPDTVTGTDPQPTWPPSVKMHFDIR